MDPKTALDIIKKLLDFLSGEKGKAIKITDVDSFHDAINKLNSPDLKNSEIVKGFKNNTITLYKKEINNTYNVFIFDKNSPEIDKIFSKLKLEKEKEGVQKVNVFPVEGKINYLGFKDDTKPLNKNYSNILHCINDTHKALLALAIDSTKYHSNKMHDTADEMKNSASEKYGDYALKFCNLWAQGYLQNIFSLLSEKVRTSTEPDKINCDAIIDGFLNEADSIEFVHKYQDKAKMDRTALKLSHLLSIKKDYVAIHGLGIAAKKAKEIADKIKDPDSDYKIVLKPSKNRFTKIWYKGDQGRYIYSLVEPLL